MEFALAPGVHIASDGFRLIEVESLLTGRLTWKAKENHNEKTRHNWLRRSLRRFALGFTKATRAIPSTALHRSGTSTAPVSPQGHLRRGRENDQAIRLI